MQEEVDAVMQWFDQWGLKVSAEKCFILPLSLTCQRDPIEYRINNTPVPVVHDSIRDLGIHFSSNLKIRPHIDIIVSKANSKIGLFFKCFKTRSQDFLKNMYAVYARSVLEYATPAWNPFLIGDIMALESVQRNFTRRLLPDSNLNYPQRLEVLNMQ